MKVLTREFGPRSPVSSEGSAKSFQKSSEWECRAIPANYAFGPFRLDAQGEALFRGTEPVALSHRAVALLRILIERAGAPVSKDALMEAAWPGQAVEESNLTVQIAALRRVLREEPGGERWIETLPRRGYRFVSPMVAKMENSGGIGHPPAAVLQPEPHTVPAPQPEPERRQLSILTCDLVCPGLDLEKRREAVKAFQNCVDGIAARLKGFVANHIDNTVIVYFGYPIAHENDAELAVRAGLALGAEVSTIDAEPRLCCRIGIATGEVIIGDLVGDTAQRGVIGEVPNVAIRLQISAQPNATVIDDVTRCLVGKLFDCREIGTIPVEPGHSILTWQVFGHGRIDSRFEALRAHQSGTTPLLGREEELDLLLRRWAQANRGEGRIVLLTGEPGIGKSRLTRALSERLQGETYTQLEYHCSPYHQESPLHPVIGQLLRATGIEHEDGGPEKLSKLESVLALTAEDHNATVALLAPLLNIPLGSQYAPLYLGPQRRKERTLYALLDQLEALAIRRPVLMILEDAHWIDPTTLELFALMIKRVARLQLLLVVTTRPGFNPPWPGNACITTVELNRLGKRESEALALSIAKGKVLPPDVLKQIMAHSDGVPLFVEELTKTVLECGLLDDAGDQYVLRGPLPPLAIPSTLHASLVARLDRLAAVKYVAQTAAAIGREFSYSLIATVARLPERDLQAALARLVDAELVFQRGSLPDAKYLFKHALVQDAAYASMVRSRRQELHGQIAKVLEEQFPDVAASEPEVLAHHFTAAGLTERGVFYWHRAGQQASDRSAYREAATHFKVGLELLNQLPDTPARAHQELALHVGLGAELIVTKGHAVPEVERSYLKARELCMRIGETPELAPILFGLWRYYNTRAHFITAREPGETLLRLAEHDPSLSVVAHFALGCTAMFSGAFVDARQHLDEGLQRYSLSLRRAPLFRIGQDPGVGCHMYASSALWFLGYPDQSVARVHDGLMMASKLSHPYTLAFAGVVAALCSQMRREVAATLEQAEAVVALATEHGFPHWAALGTILCGWALAIRDRSEVGIAQLSEGIATFRANDVSVSVPYALTLQAEAAMLVGHIDEGLRSLDDAQAMLKQQEDRWFEAEIYRLRGELLLRQSSTPDAEAETWLRRALDIARSQQAKSLELRAATSLAHLWHAQGKHSKARNLLCPVYGWFTEGFDTVDLRDARRLLERLSG